MKDIGLKRPTYFSNQNLNLSKVPLGNKSFIKPYILNILFTCVLFTASSDIIAINTGNLTNYIYIRPISLLNI